MSPRHRKDVHNIHSRFSVKDAGTDGLCFIIAAVVSSRGYSGVLQLNADNLMPCSAALPPLARSKIREHEHLCTCAVPPQQHLSVVLGRSKPVVDAVSCTVINTRRASYNKISYS